MLRRLLVFPCGSEIGLEIHRALRYSAHFVLIGASSTEDHGRFVFDEYHGDLPYHDHPGFPQALASLVKKCEVDAIYPAMDAVAETLQKLAPQLGVRIIGSSPETTAICASKRATYTALAVHLPVPRIYGSLREIDQFPVFIKPDRGYGSRHCQRADSRAEAEAALNDSSGGEKLILEFLPGREWTIDCFSDRHGELRFHGVRGRDRISNGISVRTRPCAEFADDFAHWALTINSVLKPRGAWFFQAKQDTLGMPKLLEVAARLGGSSSLFRCQGVNFALLSTFDAFEMDVSIHRNAYDIELDRALDNRYRLTLDYSNVYIDLDDCIIQHGKTNHLIAAFIHKSHSDGKGVHLLTRHKGDLTATLKKHRISELFDSQVHITDGSPKSAHIVHSNAIFIDDSFAERVDVSTNCSIPTFSPDMVEALL